MVSFFLAIVFSSLLVWQPTFWNYLFYPKDIRCAIYTTNAIKTTNFFLRKVTRNKSSFPDDDSIYKVMYPAIKKASTRCTMSIKDWGLAVNQFSILFDVRVPVFNQPLPFTQNL